ncbi:MAG: NfeD family protein [Bdellovibrionota bacterium]
MDLPVWIIWAAVSGALFVIEIMTGTFFIICFALGALGASIASASGLGDTAIWAVFAILSALAVLFSRKLADKMSGQSARASNSDQLINSEGKVIKAVNSLNFDGKVMVSGARWSAKSVNEQNFTEGEVIKVVGMEGAYLIVAKGD